MSEVTLQANCWCITCEDQWLQAQEMNGGDPALFGRIFIVCPDCGNKRCPRATHHDNTCTGSNEVGQPGSAWENVR